MKLHSNANDSTFRISAYDRNTVTVAEQALSADFIITAHELFTELPRVDVTQLRWQNLQQLHDLELQVLLIGSGHKQRFPDAALYAELSRQRIGLEAMDLAAACRTYNILVAEDRRVAALIMFD